MKKYWRKQLLWLKSSLAFPNLLVCNVNEDCSLVLAFCWGLTNLVLVEMAKECVNKAFESTLAEGIQFERRTFQSTFATVNLFVPCIGLQCPFRKTRRLAWLLSLKRRLLSLSILELFTLLSVVHAVPPYLSPLTSYNKRFPRLQLRLTFSSLSSILTPCCDVRFQ